MIETNLFQWCLDKLGTDDDHEFSYGCFERSIFEVFFTKVFHVRYKKTEITKVSDYKQLYGMLYECMHNKKRIVFYSPIKIKSNDSNIIKDNLQLCCNILPYMEYNESLINVLLSDIEKYSKYLHDIYYARIKTKTVECIKKALDKYNNLKIIIKDDNEIRITGFKEVILDRGLTTVINQHIRLGMLPVNLTECKVKSFYKGGVQIIGKMNIIR